MRCALLLCLSSLSTLCGCSSSALPGTLLGTYRIVATLQSNGCGAGLSPPNPWHFDVQLSEKDATLYWSRMDGTAALSNALDARLHTSLETTTTGNVDGTVDGGLGPCTMQRQDSVDITLRPGSPPATFAGTIGYAFSVSSGANCSDQLAPAGGIYDALPCSVSYSAIGTRQ